VQGADLIRKINGLLQYHYKIDPNTLSDDEWCWKWKELKWVLSFETKRIDAKDNLIL
jgi:hypothetical protein